MQKIDRLGWAAGIAFESYGLKLGVRTNDPAALERIRDRLPPGWRPLSAPLVNYLLSLRIGGPARRPGVRNYSLLYGDPKLLARSLDPEPLFDALEGALQLHVAFWAEERVFIHAGVVGWKGQAIVIPGLSMSGKSTLVAELVRAGASYYSDEYAVLDERGRVHPYARRLSLRQPDGKPPKRCSADELGGASGTEPLPVGTVVVTKFLEGARWRPRPLTAGKAVLEIMFHTVPTTRKPETVLRTMQQVTTGARKLASLRGEARAAAEAILEEVGR